MKYLIFFIFILFSCKQKQPAELISKEKKPITKAKSFENQKKINIIQFLLDEEIKENKSGKVDYKNHSVSFENDGNSYQVHFSELAAEDLNHDGVQDYIVERNSEGILGGNANTNSEILYIIFDGKKILQKHSILTYAPFSYNILDNIIYKKGALKASATQNYRTYMIPSDSLESTDLSFIYKDNNVYEESYLSECELAKGKNKKIFRTNAEHTQTINMDNYTEVINENYQQGDLKISAELSGCDNLEISFDGAYKLKDFSTKSITNKRIEFLKFLSENTVFSKELNVVQAYYLNHEPNEYVEKGNLSFNIFTDQGKKEITFRLVLHKYNNPKQKENWEITTRAK